MHHDVTKVINSKEQVPRGRKVKRCGNVTDGSKCRIGKRKRLDQSVQPRGLGASKNQDEFPGKRHIRNTTSSQDTVRIPRQVEDQFRDVHFSTTPPPCTWCQPPVGQRHCTGVVRMQAKGFAWQFLALLQLPSS